MTNPPVPATPLDVEACVRLLTRVAFLIERVGFDLDIAEMVGQEPEETNPPEDINLIEAEQQGQADGLRALASALSGMGKDSERLQQIREQCRVIYYGTPDMYPIEHAPGANKDSWEWMMLHLDADAARAAQPEETSADERP